MLNLFLSIRSFRAGQRCDLESQPFVDLAPTLVRRGRFWDGIVDGSNLVNERRMKRRIRVVLPKRADGAMSSLAVVKASTDQTAPARNRVANQEERRFIR
jgi:hypothetical protein